MMFKRRHYLLLFSLLHLVVYIIMGLFPHLITSSGFIPFSPTEINVDEAYLPPSWRLSSHFLGTDNLGRDVFAGIVYGCQTSLLVSFPAMLITSVIGIGLGLIGGYYGNYQKKISWVGLAIFILLIALGLYYGLYLLQFELKEAFGRSFHEGAKVLSLSLLIFLSFILLAYLINRVFDKYIPHAPQVFLPLDEMVLKLTELLSSVPRLILILSLAAFVRPSLGVLIFIIGFTNWTDMTRLVRGEILKVKGLQFIEAGRALGLKDKVLILKHILPNAIPSTIVAFTFGLANLLALESTLSFLGIGLPPEYVSWGKIIASVRYNFSAWWLAVFPGVYLILTVLALHTYSNYLLNKFRK